MFGKWGSGGPGIQGVNHSQFNPTNLHKNYMKILCELSRMCELSMYQSQWENIQFCEITVQGIIQGSHYLGSTVVP